MMQALNPDTNTLGAKSINSALTASAVEPQVLLEQMRYQIQNIE